VLFFVMAVKFGVALAPVLIVTTLINPPADYGQPTFWHRLIWVIPAFTFGGAAVTALIIVAMSSKPGGVGRITYIISDSDADGGAGD
jgi:hypothetical protein